MSWTHRAVIVGALASMPSACGDGAGGDGSSGSSTSASTGPVVTTITTGEPDPGTSSSGGPAMTTAMTTVPADSTTATGGSESGPPVYFDLGILPESPIQEGPCGKVDFLFIIDNSGSMAEEQAALVTSFPGFIAAIQSTLDTVKEYNVGIITTDAYFANTAVPGCSVLGGLVTRTGGFQSSNMTCGPFDAGNDYMTEADDLEVAFSCAAQVGTEGDGFELPMSAMIIATNPDDPLADPGACNEGFIRDDALLVIVIITDENDGPTDPEGAPSPGTAMDWYDAVVANKDDIPENIVVVSLVNSAGGPCPPVQTLYDGVHIVEFTQMFGKNGLVGGVCELDYSPVFTDAVAIIDTACDNFMPPG